MEPRGPICLEAGSTILEASNGCPPGAPVLDAAVLPGLCNAHLHVLDAVLAEHGEDLVLEKLVSQPRGLKYRLLQAAAPERLVSAAASVLEELRRGGTVYAISYAEMGWLGAAAVEEASRIAGLPVGVAAQPMEKRPAEYLALAERYGLGLDTPFDLEPRLLREAASRARGPGLHVHVSEDPALAAMGDYLLVEGSGAAGAAHLTHLGPGEARLLAEEGTVPIYCPVSNYYHMAALPDPRGLLQLYLEGLPAGLGSDNAAWLPVDTRLLVSTSYLLLRPFLGPGPSPLLARALLYAATVGCTARFAPSEGLLVLRVPLLGYTGDPAVTVAKRMALSAVVYSSPSSRFSSSSAAESSSSPSSLEAGTGSMG